MNPVFEDDANFWLPAEFLDDEDVLIEFQSGKPTANRITKPSGLSSPETVTETETDDEEEEDYLNELSLKLARSALDDDVFDNHSSSSSLFKSARVMAGSPQSTLHSGNQFSSRGSSNCPSPPPVSHTESPWDVLCAAAGEVARLKLAEEVGFSQRVSQQPRIPSPNPQFNPIQLKKQQLLLQQQQQQYQQFVLQNRGVNGINGSMKPVTAPLSGWPTIQQSQQAPLGSGMRAVFLGNPNMKRECTGTGVFLPRQVGAPTETRKKRGCSTVLLPDRVVHALNLNLEPQTRSNAGFARHNYDLEMRYRNNVMMAEQRRPQVEMDLRLPQEWTY